MFSLVMLCLLTSSNSTRKIRLLRDTVRKYAIMRLTMSPTKKEIGNMGPSPEKEWVRSPAVLHKVVESAVNRKEVGLTPSFMFKNKRAGSGFDFTSSFPKYQ